MSLRYRVIIPVLCAVAAAAVLQAQPMPRDSFGIPAGALSRAHAFVLAHQGQAYLFNYASGVVRFPLLSGVYRSFGFSYDSRQLLYLKSNGVLPGFRLFARDMAAGSETEIGGGSVLYAAWSPAGPELAYIRIGPAGRFHLVLFDLRTGSGSEVASGALHPDFLEWSPNGDQLLYLTAAPSTGAANEHRFVNTLHQYRIGSGNETVIPDVDWARFDGGTLVLASRAPVAGRRVETSAAGQEVRNFMVAAGYTYATVGESGKLSVRRSARNSGVQEHVADGEVYAATDDGIVVRRFTAAGVSYRYVPIASAAAPEAFVFNAEWKMPFQGSAYLVQGGSLFANGACDGRACLISSHSGAWGYALDWLQAPEEGQGNNHVLAVEDGTVVAVENNVACNSGSPTCFVGWDDYQKPCADTSGGLGNFVSIAHADGSYSFYGHLKSGSVQVAPNQVVTRGTYLGDQGHSGVAATYNNYRLCGDHLHFQRQTGAAPWSQSIATDFSELPCSLSCTSAYLSQNVETGAETAAALTVVLAPSTMIGAATSGANRVILGSAAPAGGATVALTSSNPAVGSVPPSVSVPAGASTATFPISTGAVTASTAVSISAAYGGENHTAVLTVVPATVTRVVFPRSSMVAGTVLSGNEIDLSGIAGVDTTISLSSSQPAVLSVPATVIIPAGASYGYFTVNAASVSAPTNVAITATDGNSSAAASLTISPVTADRINVAASVTGGSNLTAQVFLTGPAPAGGAVVTLSSSSVAASVPSGVTVPGGAWSASFAITTSTVPAPVQVTISAAYGGSTARAVVAVNALCTVTSVSPAAGLTGTSVPVTITGTNFDASSTVTVGNAGVGVAGTVVASPTQISTTLVIAANALPGPAALAVSTNGSTSNAVVFTIVSAVFQPVRINAGGLAYTDSSGRVWSADTGYTYGGSVTDSAVVTGTPDPVLYQTAHWGSDPTGPPLTYRIPVPNGAYTVNLKFDDNRMDQPGRRLFDIIINGAIVAKDFDIVAHAGAMHQAFDIQFPVTVTNLEIVIQFAATLYFPRVGAIEILAGAPPAPTVTALAPNSAAAGASIPVTISGTDLDPSLVINAGPGISVTNVKVTSASSATATFAVAPGASTGPAGVLVITPGGAAATVAFWITPAGPAVSSILPASGIQGATVPVTITGTNFDATATVSVGNPGVTVSNVSVVSATRIDADFAIAPGAAVGPAPVIVTTSTAAAQPVSFTINPPAPVLVSLTPATGVAGTSVTVSLAGSNLAGALVAIGGTGVSVSNVSSTGTLITATFTIASNAPAGNYTVTAVNAGVASNPVMFAVKVPAGIFTPIRINAGGAAYTDGFGQSWAPDSGYNNGGVATATATIQGTSDQPLYQTWRWGPSSGTPLTYTFQNIPSGSYTVVLKFDETLYSQAGQRVFHVAINGQTVLSNFDILQAAGARLTAVDRNIPIDVSSGRIVIQFVPVVSNPKICAIEIVSSGVSTGPALTGITPASGSQGTSVDVTLTGSNLAGAAINAPPGITVTNVNSAPGQVTATFAIAANATTGARNVTVTTGSGTSGAVAFTVNAAVPAFTPIRINAGGAAYTDALGRRWSADANFNNGGVSNTTTAIAGTSDQGLYQVWRWGPSAGTPLAYTFNQIPNGTYTVTLKFDETLFTQAGQRVFHVLINGQTVLSNFDILQAAGARYTAVDRQFTIAVTNGQMTIQFIPVVSNPKICAIQIE